MHVGGRVAAGAAVPHHGRTLADVLDDAVELVEAVVVHHQLAPAAAAVLDGHARAELVGQLPLQALDVGIAGIRVVGGGGPGGGLQPARERPTASAAC